MVDAAIFDGVHELTRTSIAFLVITTVAVGLRFYTRAVLLGRFALDDYAMIMAYLFCIAESTVTLVLMTLATKLFTGHYENINTLLTIIKAETACYILSLLFLKISLGIFFLHIFSVHLPQQIIIYSVLCISIVFSVIYLTTTAATCGLTSAVVGTPCPSFDSAYQNIAWGWSWTNVITDLVFTGIAVHAMWNATMTRAARVGAMFVLCCGTAGGLVSLIRIIVIQRFRFYEVAGGSYVQSLQSGEWTVVETGMVITAASLACTRPLVQKVWPYVFGSSGTARSKSGHVQGMEDGERIVGPGVLVTGTEGEYGMSELREHTQKKDGSVMYKQVVTV